MKIVKKIIDELVFPYAVELFQLDDEKQVVAASESVGRCIIYSPGNDETTTVWEGSGGTMAISQLNDKPDFLAIMGFYKGMRAADACLSKVVKGHDGAYTLERYIELPYAHRFCIAKVEDTRFLIACTIAAKKSDRDDWSTPGAAYIGELPEDLAVPCRLMPLIEGIYKNHGLFSGVKDGKRVIMVSGQEGLFQIDVPDTSTGEWNYVKLLDKEISDIFVYDLDGDGQDELCTVEGFHGDQMRIYKKEGCGYKEVYSYEAEFGHAIWCGDIFGKPSVILGHRGGSGSLLLLQKKPCGEYSMDVTVIDENQAPNNIRAYQCGSEFRIYATCGGPQVVCMYVLTE